MVKKALSFFTLFIVIIMCSSLALHVFAANENALVVSNISPFALEKNMSANLNAFSETNEGFDCIDKSTDVTVSETIPTAPYYPLTGDGCLTVRNEKTKNDNYLYSSKKYNKALDLSEYKTLFVSANCLPVENSEYKFFIQLYSKYGSFTAEQSITASNWSGIFIDISKWRGASSVSEIRLGIKYTSSTVNEAFFEYYVDSIMASNKENVMRNVQYLSSSYKGIGCTVEYENKKMILKPTSDTVHIETQALDYGNIGTANSLKVSFEAEGKCGGVRLFVQDEDTEYREESFYSLKNDLGKTKICYLPISETSLKNIRLVFEGIEAEKIIINAIVPYSINAKDTSSIGHIDTCAVNASSNEVLIMGKLNNTHVEAYSKNELLLFEQSLSDDTTPEALSQLNSSLKTTVGSGDFIFRIKCNKTEDLKSHIYKKYTVAIKTDEGYVMLDSPKCITNPEALSKQTSNASSNKKSGKGYFGGSLSFLQENNIGDTCISVDIGKFFSPSQSAGTKLECGGSVFYYNADYIEQIDSLLSGYSQKNIGTTLIITLCDTGNDSLNKILVHPDADFDAKNLAYNTTNKTALSYLRAFCEFFAQRYCIDTPCVTRVVFGTNVTDTYNNYNMGKKTLADFVNDYTKGLIIANNAFKSSSKAVSIYTHIDNIWNTELPFDFSYRFDNRDFLEGLNNCTSSYGNFNWGVAINPYPQNQVDYLAFKSAKDNSIKNDHLSFANLEILTDFLSGGKFLYNNSPRNIVVIEETSFEKTEPSVLAADYAYCYYKAKTLSISAYITDRICNYNNIMKYIDTLDSKDYTQFALDIVGTDDWQNIISGINFDKICNVGYIFSEFEKSPPNKKGSIEISDFSNGVSGFVGYNLTEELSAEKEMSGRNDLISVKLGKIPYGQSRGITKVYSSPFDMSLIPILHFDINIASLPVNVNSAKLTVKITSGNDIIEFSRVIDKAVWTEIYCDMTDYAGIGKVDSISILLSGENGEEFDAPQFFLSAIEGISLEHDSEYLKAHIFGEEPEHGFITFMKKYAVHFLAAVIFISLFILGFRYYKAKKQ